RPWVKISGLGYIPQLESPCDARIPDRLRRGVVNEAENSQKKLYGIEKLLQVIQQHYQQSPREIVAAIVENVQDHIGDRPIYDDMTLLALKRNF
ncbi:MAG: SpoIIE family protein phosphatase, partial [Spirulinaceae cyanobacterium]